MKNYESPNINSSISIFLLSLRSRKILLVVFLIISVGFQCNAQVKTSIDSISVQIGQEIRYKMEVEADSTDVIVFPEGQTFSPLEVIESFKVDTAQHSKRLKLYKEYALTQFDSGHYTIPRQKIMIGDRVIYTDSLKVNIRDVVVDTSKQKMYAIKPLVAVDASFFDWEKLIWGLLAIIALIGLIVFLLLRRKKKKEAKKEELPAYEKAMLALKRIDESHLLEQDSHKEYYSQLSDTARKYIDEEVYDHALESTTDELIIRLDEEIKSGSLNLDKHIIEELKTVLKTADMAKFARSKPDIGTAKADRNVIERVINETKEAIPELTEEELLADEEYRIETEKKQLRKKIIIGASGIVLLAFLTFIGFGIGYGFNVVKDTIFGHPTKDLAEAEWISSTYGAPAVTISTPKVLIRNNFQLTEEQKQVLKGNETFVYGGLLGDFYIAVSTVQFNQQAQQQVDLEKAVEGAIKGMEQQGAKNITFKTDEYETLKGAKGLKVFGELEGVHPITKKANKAEYLMLYFGEDGGFQQIIVVYTKEDRYAKDVAERIINSVELKNAE